MRHSHRRRQQGEWHGVFSHACGAKIDVVYGLARPPQVLDSPARCVICMLTWLHADHVATSLRKSLSGGIVVKSLLMPASALVLSQAAGRAKRQCFACMRVLAIIASASCARVSKQAMYFCGASTSCGQCRLSSSMFHCSANQANWVAVLIHPPIPTILPSALASAAAMQCIIGCCFSERILEVAKHCASQVRAARLSLRRCSSLRCGSCRRTHCGLCDGGILGTELLPVIAMLPTSRTLAPSGSHMPIGLCTTSCRRVHLGMSAMNWRAHCAACPCRCAGLCKEAAAGKW